MKSVPEFEIFLNFGKRGDFFRDCPSGRPSGRPAGLEIESTRHRVDVENLTDEIRVRHDFRFHGLAIDFGKFDASSGNELLSGTGSDDRKRYSIGKDLREDFAFFAGNGGTFPVGFQAAKHWKDFGETAREENLEGIFQFFRAFFRKSGGKLRFPIFEPLRSVGNDKDVGGNRFGEFFECHLGGEREDRGSGNSKMGEHHRSLRYRTTFHVGKARVLKGESGKVGTPGVRTDVRGKRRCERGDGMSERTCDRVSESVASRFRIRRAAGRDDDRIEPFGAVLETNVESVSGRDDFLDFRTEARIAARERPLEYGYHVGRIVGNGENAQVFLDFQSATARHEPFHRLLRGKRAEGTF